MPTVPSPRRGRPPKHSRPILLTAASHVLIERGYGNLRYRDVADAAGVPVASLQHYFPNLAELRREALLHQVGSEVSRLADEVSHIADPWEKLRRIVCVSIGEPDEEDNRAEWTLWLEYWRAAAHEEEIAEHNKASQQVHYGLIESAVLAGIEAGIFAPSCSPTVVAETILAMVDGFGIQLALTDNESTPEHAIGVVEETIRALVNADADLPRFVSAQARLA